MASVGHIAEPRRELEAGGPLPGSVGSVVPEDDADGWSDIATIAILPDGLI